MTTILAIGGKLPTIGGLIRGLKITIDQTKPSFKTGLDRAKAVDDKTYPWKDKVDRGVDACEEGGRLLTPCLLCRFSYNHKIVYVGSHQYS